MKRIEQGEWEDKYKPIKKDGGLKDFHPNVINGQDKVSLLKAVTENRVWTMVDDGEDLPIISGLHRVNRMDVYITEVPYEEDMEVYFD